MCYKKGVYVLYTSLAIPLRSSPPAKMPLTQMGTLHYYTFTRRKFTLEINRPAPGPAAVSGTTILIVLHWARLSPWQNRHEYIQPMNSAPAPHLKATWICLGFFGYFFKLSYLFFVSFILCISIPFISQSFCICPLPCPCNLSHSK